MESDSSRNICLHQNNPAETHVLERESPFERWGGLERTDQVLIISYSAGFGTSELTYE